MGKWSLLEWKKLSSNYRDARDIPEEKAVLELLKDGVGIMEGKRIAWKIENGRFVMKYVDSKDYHPNIFQKQYTRDPWDYKISGSTLTLANTDTSMTFKRQ